MVAVLLQKTRKLSTWRQRVEVQLLALLLLQYRQFKNGRSNVVIFALVRKHTHSICIWWEAKWKLVIYAWMLHAEVLHASRWAMLLLLSFVPSVQQSLRSQAPCPEFKNTHGMATAQYIWKGRNGMSTSGSCKPLWFAAVIIKMRKDFGALQKLDVLTKSFPLSFFSVSRWHSHDSAPWV